MIYDNINSQDQKRKRRPLKNKELYKNNKDFEYHTFMYDIFSNINNDSIIIVDRLLFVNNSIYIHSRTYRSKYDDIS